MSKALDSFKVQHYPGLFNAMKFMQSSVLLREQSSVALKRKLTTDPGPPSRSGAVIRSTPHALFSILAVMSGATSYRRIHQFMATHQQRLNEAFGCRWRRTPAYSSIRYVLQGLDPSEIAPHFRAHATTLAETSPVIALDGKTLRGSLDRFEDRKAAQRLIETLGLSGRLYTLDALHLQKKPLKP